MTKQTRAAVTLAVTVAVVVAAAAVAAFSLRHYHKQVAAASAATSPTVGPTTRPSSPSPSEPAVVQASLPSVGFSYLGVYEGSALDASQYGQVEQFAQAAGRQPNIVLYYSGWGEGFSSSYAQTALQHGATLLADIDPTSTSCAAIAAGQQDAFLQSYAQSVKDFGHPVIISFGHEMNGNWYPWGWTHTNPAVFVAAWRHMVNVFRQVGADNVTWLWTVNSVRYLGPISEFYPGDNYVTWVGLDAYYYNSSDDFSGVFGTSIASIRQVTQKPVLIAETAIGQVSGQVAKIPGLFAGISNSGLLGLVWFDIAQNDGIYHQDWRLEGHPNAISAFRSAATRYLK